LATKFSEMMSTLVSFHGDMSRMEEQIRWIAFRHIKYGARPQHAKVMGDVLLETLARATGDEWTLDMATSWADLWNKCCEMMMAFIGRNLDVYTHNSLEMIVAPTDRLLDVNTYQMRDDRVLTTRGSSMCTHV
jgi:hemoglobin-like flavoprotein